MHPRPALLVYEAGHAPSQHVVDGNLDGSLLWKGVLQFGLPAERIGAGLAQAK
jgi:hypothetical protein